MYLIQINIQSQHTVPACLCHFPMFSGSSGSRSCANYRLLRVTSRALLGGATKELNRNYLELVSEGSHSSRWHEVCLYIHLNVLVHTYLDALCS